MGILDILTNPAFSAGAGLLASSEAGQGTGAGLLAGIGGFNQQQLANQQLTNAALRQTALQRAADAEKRRQEARTRQREVLGRQQETATVAGPPTAIQAAQGVLPSKITQEGSGVLGGNLTPEEQQRALLEIAGLSENPSAAITGVLNALKPEGQTIPNIIKVAESLGLKQGTKEFNSFVREATLRPSTQINLGQQVKPPNGFMFEKPDNPVESTPPFKVIPIPGGPVGRKTPEQAAKLSLLQTAKTILPSVRGALIKDGKVDRETILTMSVNAPFSEGRIIRSQILDMIEAKLRAESGAAVPQTEVERIGKRFMPSNLDKDSGIIEKLDRLELFLDSALEKTDPELFERLKNIKDESVSGIRNGLTGIGQAASQEQSKRLDSLAGEQ